MTMCLVCGKQTANPRFCSRSCAAQHNNKENPKRRLEGSCEHCGAAIPKRDKFCKTCLAEVRAEKQRQLERENANVRRWRTSAGTWTEAPTNRAEMQKRVVFRLHSVPFRAALETVGELVDTLIGICFSGPEYLRYSDAARYVALFNEFKDFEFQWWGGGKPTLTAVKDLPTNFLGNALAAWVHSYFDDKHHPLMPAYALDAAMFVNAHVETYYSSHPQWWEIEPIPLNREPRIYEAFDQAFKRNFTSRFGGTLVRCRVPENAAIKYNGRKFIGAGAEFCAALKRCHLSTNITDDVIYFSTVDANDDRITLDLGFSFIGEMLVEGSGSLYDWDLDPETVPFEPALLPESSRPLWEFRRFDVEIPATWIVAAIDDPMQKRLLRPAPHWDAEIEGKNGYVVSALVADTVQ